MNPLTRQLALALSAAAATAALSEDAGAADLYVDGATCTLITLSKGSVVTGCKQDNLQRPVVGLSNFSWATETSPFKFDMRFKAAGDAFVGRGNGTGLSIHPGNDFADSLRSLEAYIVLKAKEGWEFIPAPDDAPHMADVFPEKGADFRTIHAAFLESLVGLTEKLEVKSNRLISTNFIDELNEAFIAVSQGAIENPWETGKAWCVLLPTLGLQRSVQITTQGNLNWPLPVTNVGFTAGWAMQHQDALKKAGLGDVRIIEKLGAVKLNADGVPLDAAGNPIKLGNLLTTKGHSHMASAYGFLKRTAADGKTEIKVITIDGNFGLPGEEGIKFVIRNWDAFIGQIDIETFTLAALDLKEEAKAQKAMEAEMRAEAAKRRATQRVHTEKNLKSSMLIK